MVSYYLHGFLYDHGKLIDLAGYPRGGTTAEAINDRGQVVYNVHFYEDCFAALWENWNRQTLGADDTIGAAINSHGQIVGYGGGALSYPDGGDRVHALLWQDGRVLKLNDCIPATSGWYLERATGINDRGQIVGFGMHNGKQHAFLLTPN